MLSQRLNRIGIAVQDYFFSSKRIIIVFLVIVAFYLSGPSCLILNESPVSNLFANGSPHPFVRILESQHLPNAIQIHPKVISGGHPADKHAFAELKKLGVRTIISVDGRQPDVELANQVGLKYVHLPHGYNGISSQRSKELAKAVRDLPGPIYIHCHHGKHRSPTAAVVACVGAKLISTTNPEMILNIAGTSLHYKGLYDCVRECSPFPKALLDQLDVEFKEQIPPPPLVESMVAIEHAFDHLKQFEEANWRQLEHHPDLDPSHEALLLKEHFTELLRLDSKSRPGDYLQLLKNSESIASQLEREIRNENRSVAEDFDPDNLKVLLAQFKQTCQTCHREFRDVPLLTHPE